MRKVSDDQVALDATAEEWREINSLLRYAAANYGNLELDYTIGEQGQGKLDTLCSQFEASAVPPLLLHKDIASLLLLAIHACEHKVIPGLSPQDVKAVVCDLSRFNFNKEFYPGSNKTITDPAEWDSFFLTQKKNQSND